jgi:hypothetical protein
MTSTSHDQLIHGLSANLKPVGRLHRPALRAALWLAVVAVIGVGLAVFADVNVMWQRLAAAPDLWLAVIGSTLTAIFAAFAAFELSLPDTSRVWAALPLPAAILWIAASGLGCLRTWLAPQAHVATLGEARDCLVFIVALSVPLSALLFVMLRRAYPVYLGLTAAIAGLAVAAAGATLLNFFHPYDAAATDLAVHALAVAIVVAVCSALTGKIFGRHFRPAGVTADRLGAN